MNSQTDLLIGVAGWSYEDWKGVVYPAGQKGKLAFMARFVDCIEINSSFYRPVSPGLAEKWVRETEDRPAFRLTAKLWSRFTHDLDEDYPHGEAEKVKRGFRPLHDSGRLVAILAQFPFYFRDGPENRDRLRRIAEDFAEYPRVLEVRDKSWARPEALDFIRDQGYNLACLDIPLTRDSFREKVVTTGPIGYLRLHGRNYDAWFSKDSGRDDRYNYLYGEDEMDFTLDRLGKLREESDRVVTIWNNHYRGKAVVNALECWSQLSGDKVDVPSPLLQSFPRLRKIARNG